MKKTKKYLKSHKEEVKDIIREYYQDFLIQADLNSPDEVFDEEAYEDSAMEGELVDAINEQIFNDNEGIMCGDDEAYDYVDELADEVLKEPTMETVKKYFDNVNI